FAKIELLRIQSLEESAESLRERSLRFYKGCRKYTEGLGEGYDGDIAFASALETFGGGHNDPISVAFGGPVMTKFTIALREIGTYKEVLRSQEARKRFDKASITYDQAREKFLSLRKGTKSDVAILLEEELHNARSTFEQARFNLVTALSTVEAKKRFEFLEAVSGTMDAHLRYFKQGYELLHQMEPYINQVLTYAQQSRERSNYEQAALSEKMQEYKRQVDRESKWSSNGTNGSPNGDGIQAIGRSSHKMIEAVMQSAAKGKVQTIRQGYLSKRSSNLRGDWKRRFFVLDSRGMLYYYRKQCSKSSCLTPTFTFHAIFKGSGSQLSGQRNSSELGSGLLSRWLSNHYHGGVHDEKSVAHHTVNLLTSTIKVDADQSDLRFCFRIISPTKNYTLQVEHMLNDRLLQFVNIDLHEVKEARKRFDKASITYDQAREKFLSLRKGTKSDVAILLEEELHNARSTFEQARFNLVTALSTVEAKKRFEFLEAVSGTMDAHLRYFKQGYELLHQMEPYINQVLTYAQQSRERSNYEQAALSEKMQEYKRQVDRESKWSSNGTNGSPNGDGIQAIGRSSHKMIEAVMQSAAKGKVQTIRQGYLSKRSSNLRGDWKRRFFVLDSRGMLYYYRKQCSKSSGSGSQLSGQRNSSELGSGLLSRWLSNHYHGGVHDEKSVAHHTVNLLTSTIKVDADQSDLRFCFRIISPTKNYTLQAESALDQMDWIEKITGVIASLLSSQAPERCLPASPMGSSHHRSASESSSFESSDFDHVAAEDYTSERSLSTAHLERQIRHMQPQRSCVKSEKPIEVLRRVCGNDKCADCGAPEPDWASLNLGVLVCIECSGVHRNLGVHISKVNCMSLTTCPFYAFSLSAMFVFLDKYCSTGQNCSYAEKLFVRRPKDNQYPHLVAQQIWEGVRANDKKAVYRHIVNSEADVNAVYEQTSCGSSLTLAKVMLLHEQAGLDHSSSCLMGDSLERSSTSSTNLAGTCEGHTLEDLDGCTLLHLACETADIGMIELLLQYGANINATDSRSQTPLHRCILRGRNAYVKLLLTRGADPRAVNVEGKNPYEVALESNFDDNEILTLLADSNG
ncbi:adp-ribosylation factor gtpase-activating protein agd3, partial [Quercus suber]